MWLPGGDLHAPLLDNLAGRGPRSVTIEDRVSAADRETVDRP
jgi:hypothetical protein